MAVKNFRNINDTLVNEGQSFSAHDEFAGGAGANDRIYVLTTHATQPAHLQRLEFYNGNVAGPLTIEVFEAAVVTVVGTGLAEDKRDRRVTAVTAPTSTWTHTPTTTNNGTLLYTKIIDTQNPIWEIIGDVKLILREGSNIHIRIRDLVGNTVVCGFNAVWQEPR